MTIDRRQFIRTSALLAAGASAGCLGLSKRLVRPEPLVGRHDKLLLTNARLIDVEHGALREESQILIWGRSIAALAHDAVKQGVTPDRTLDLGGAYVVPGLINAHVHIAMPGAIGTSLGYVQALERQQERNAEACITHGVTTVRDMLPAANRVRRLKRRIRAGDVVGPRILCAHGLDVPSGYTDKLPFNLDGRFWTRASDPRDARDGVRRMADHGADLIKLFHQPQAILQPVHDLPVMDLKTMTAVRNEADRLGLPVALHHTTADGMLQGLAAGITDLQHLVRDRLLTDDEIRRAADAGATLVPTVSIGFVLSFERPGDPHWSAEPVQRIAKMRERVLPENIREFSEPRAIESTLEFIKDYADPQYFETRHVLPAPEPLFFTSSLTYGLQNLRKLHDAGVGLGCGNDGGVPFTYPGAMALEMNLIEDAGFSPADVLRQATLNNARLLGIEHWLGTLTPGKLADLAMFDENPLQSTRNLAHPKMVFLGGQLAFSA